MPDKKFIDDGGALNAGQKTRLSLLIFASRLALFWERALPYLLLPAALAALFLILSWSGVFESLPPLLTRLAVLILFFTGLVSLVPLARQPYPEKKEAIARLDAGTRYRVISTLSDRLGLKSSAEAGELWKLHQKRLAAMLQMVRIFRPHPNIARDKYGLRFALILGLCITAAIAGPDRLAKIRHALESGSFGTTPPRLDAWITPPAYTGRAPVFLDFNKKDLRPVSLSVPANSVFALRTAAGQGVELRIGNASARQVQASEDAKLVRFESRLDHNIDFHIQYYGRALAEGSVTVEPDLPPKITLMGPVQVMLGKSLRVRAKVEDDYGVAQAAAQFILSEDAPKTDFRLNKASKPQPLVEPPQFPLSLGTSHPRAAETSTIKDLSDHPFAGLPAKVTLSARDEAGQVTIIDAGRVVLPARPFSKPAAEALIALRQTLALDKRSRMVVSNAFDLIMSEPAAHLATAQQYLQMSALRTQLLLARDDDGLRSVVQRMWEVANYIENGDLSDAERALAEAQAALERAIENNASAEEISKLMQNLRQAMAEYLKELQDQASRSAKDGKIPPNMKFLTENDLEQLMKRIEQLSKSGAKDAARQQLQNLRDLLNALRNSDPSASGQASAMQKQLNDIAGLMRDQQKLMDQTFQERNRSRQSQPGVGNPQPGAPQPQQNGSAMQELEQKQGQLRDKLQGLENSLPQSSEKSGKAMKDAEGSMGNAQGYLQQNAPAGALPEQGKALESMRKGAQALMKEMGGGEGGSGNYGYNEGEGGARGQAQFNPFGLGEDLADGNRVPSEADRKTIQDILDEVKRRLSDPSRPKPERDYLERLLRPF